MTPLTESINDLAILMEGSAELEREFRDLKAWFKRKGWIRIHGKRKVGSTWQKVKPFLKMETDLIQEVIEELRRFSTRVGGTFGEKQGPHVSQYIVRAKTKGSSGTRMLALFEMSWVGGSGHVDTISLYEPGKKIQKPPPKKRGDQSRLDVDRHARRR